MPAIPHLLFPPSCCISLAPPMHRNTLHPQSMLPWNILLLYRYPCWANMPFLERSTWQIPAWCIPPCCRPEPYLCFCGGEPRISTWIQHAIQLKLTFFLWKGVFMTQIIQCIRSIFQGKLQTVSINKWVGIHGEGSALVTEHRAATYRHWTLWFKVFFRFSISRARSYCCCW